MSESTMPPVPRPIPYLAWAQTPLGKAGLLLLLLLLLQWPLILVSDLIAERQRRQADVSGEMGQSWGPEQTVAGPVLAVPVVRTYIITGAGRDAANGARAGRRCRPRRCRFRRSCNPRTGGGAYFTPWYTRLGWT